MVQAISLTRSDGSVKIELEFKQCRNKYYSSPSKTPSGPYVILEHFNGDYQLQLMPKVSVLTCHLLTIGIVFNKCG